VLDNYGGPRLAIDIQLVDLSLDQHRILRLNRDELPFDGLDQAGADRVELGGEVGCVHLSSFAVRLVVYILVSAAECGGLACRGKLIQLFGGCRCEVNKPDESKFTA